MEAESNDATKVHTTHKRALAQVFASRATATTTTPQALLNPHKQDSRERDRGRWGERRRHFQFADASATICLISRAVPAVQPVNADQICVFYLSIFFGIFYLFIFFFGEEFAKVSMSQVAVF